MKRVIQTVVRPFSKRSKVEPSSTSPTTGDNISESIWLKHSASRSSDSSGPRLTISSSSTYSSRRVTANMVVPFCFNFKESVSCDLHNVNWKDIRGIQKSNDGASGVYFIQFNSEEDGHPLAVVLKSTLYNTQETFASVLGQTLGVKVPKTRLICTNSYEGRYILGNIEPVDHTAYHALRTFKDFIIMEYIPGDSMGRSEEALDEADGMLVARSLNDMTCCEDIGRVLLFDLLINNCDRIPLTIWDNHGNCSNLYIQVDNKQDGRLGMAAIDSVTTCLSNEVAVVKYLERIRNMLQSILNCQHNPADSLFSISLKRFLETNTDMTVSNAQILSIQQGFCKMWQSISDEIVFTKQLDRAATVVNNMLNNVRPVKGNMEISVQLKSETTSDNIRRHSIYLDFILAVQQLLQKMYDPSAIQLINSY